jgi:cob(I)alamin adenosyltransferase
MGLYSKTKDLIQKKLKETSIVGSKAAKTGASIHFLGDADELNSHLGLVKAMLFDKEHKRFLEGIQKNIMKLMSHAADISNKDYFLTEDDITVLENEINGLKTKLPEQSQFVYPDTMFWKLKYILQEQLQEGRKEDFTMLVNLNYAGKPEFT